VSRSRDWTKLVALTAFLLLSPTASFGQAVADQTVVEMIIVPCTPQTPPDECGVKVSVSGGGTATFTTTSGETFTVSSGQALSVSGGGIVTQAAQNGTMLNFASAGSSSQTGSTGSTGGEAGGAGGGGGGGGGGQITPLPGGGGGGGGTGAFFLQPLEKKTINKVSKIAG